MQNKNFCQNGSPPPPPPFPSLFLALTYPLKQTLLHNPFPHLFTPLNHKLKRAKIWSVKSAPNGRSPKSSRVAKLIFLRQKY